MKNATKRLHSIQEPYFTAKFAGELKAIEDELSNCLAQYAPEKDVYTLPAFINDPVEKMTNLLNRMIEQQRPDFFRIGFYTMKNPGADLFAQDMDKVNEMTLKFLDENFMIEFIGLLGKTVEYSFRKHLEAKRALLAELKEAEAYFAGDFTKSAALSYGKALTKKVNATIDRLEMHKDPAAYTFGSSVASGIEKYFYYKKKNPRKKLVLLVRPRSVTPIWHVAE